MMIKNFRPDAYRVYLFLEWAISLIFMVVFTVSQIYYIQVANLNPLQLVLVGTVLEATVFLFEIPTGVIADVYSRRLSIIVGYFLIGAGFLLEGSLPVFWAIAAAQVLWGLGYTFTSGATEAWISDEIGEQRANRAFLRANQAGMIGSLIGIAIAVILGSIRLNVPILVSGGLFILLAVVLIGVMPERGFKPTPREARGSWGHMAATVRDGFGMVKRRPVLGTILAIGLFFGLYSEGFDRLWAKHMLDGITFPAGVAWEPVVWFGVIEAVGLLLSVLATEVVRRRGNTAEPAALVRLLTLNTLGLVLALLVFGQATLPWLGLGMIWLISIIRQVNSPLYTAWVNQRLDPKVRATVLSMSNQVDALGQIAGGPVLGVIGNLVSVRAAITASGLVLSPVLLLFQRASRHPGVLGQPVTSENPGMPEEQGD